MDTEVTISLEGKDATIAVKKQCPCCGSTTVELLKVRRYITGTVKVLGWCKLCHAVELPAVWLN